MESMGNHEDQLTNSIEQVDPHEQDVGPVARLYECIFCRRGFTTAQALGGHMNIHRRERAKSRPSYLSNNNSNKKEDHSFYANPRFYHPVFASCPQTSNTPNNQEGDVRYRTCFSSTSSTAQPVNHENNHQDFHGVVKSPSREEKMMSLSLQFGWSHGEDDDRESKRRTVGGSDEDELDLELRLGNDYYKNDHS
ncbi:hypothetical protein L1987_50546 [Smallanthus sonchifolius]|uniref:Uncharacterized protein n=1 Tax=Smallanthus sonchifolius TaxID=185202 RepID=A0ACB9EMX6_9ASTR|nr:hypothetical protein L1987_50546 [Smallanthus sonchifolius]